MEYVKIKVKAVLGNTEACIWLSWGSHSSFPVPPSVDLTSDGPVNSEPRRCLFPLSQAIMQVCLGSRYSSEDKLWVNDFVQTLCWVCMLFALHSRQVGWPRVYRWSSWGSERQSHLLNVTQLGSGRTSMTTLVWWFQSLPVQPTARGLSITLSFWYLWAWLCSGA